MVRTAILTSGDGARLQTILDSMYFNEIPNFELVAVICTEQDAYAMRRARNAKVPAFAVEPEDFPTKLSYSMAISAKLKDMDVDLVVLAGYKMPLGVIASQFRNRIIGTFPALIPACENEKNPVRAVLERGSKVTGATAYFADVDGNIGPVIMQKAIDINPTDNERSLTQRIVEEAEWKILPASIILYCQNRLEIRGGRTVIKE